MSTSEKSFIKLTSQQSEKDVFSEAQELLDRLSDIICACPTCLEKLRASKK
jgi:hypothetical protein